MKYWPWIVLAVFDIGWFMFWEVKAFKDGAATTTLSEALRAFTRANPVFPYLAAGLLVLLAFHLYYRWGK